MAAAMSQGTSGSCGTRRGLTFDRLPFLLVYTIPNLLLPSSSSATTSSAGCLRRRRRFLLYTSPKDFVRAGNPGLG
uniref:Uncharacterized protein n=1 Tax=Zea mays TaxID=4577 RepID=C4IYD4_MAIZE|nr:unknown [Zea mays]